MSDRELDVVVFGASGVTGRQVAVYLQERAAESSFRWAVAGRNAEKVRRTLDEVGVSAPESISADIGDAGSLAAMAGRAAVVLDLVGPYTLYGRPVIEACVQGGTHYVDLTGEIPFVRAMIDDFDASARAAGVKVAQVCGFESLPVDLAVRLAAERARERWDESLQGVDVEVSFTSPPGPPRPTDMISGGTAQSLVAVAAADGAERISDPAVLITDPNAADAVRQTSPIAIAPRKGHTGEVLGPMAPSPFINPAVIHRSAVLADAAAERPASAFRYREGLVLPGGAATRALRWGVAGTLTGTHVGVRRIASANPHVRKRFAAGLGRVMPSSGFGPTGERLKAWKWSLATYAQTTSGHTVVSRVDADGHPGYLTTARMLGEMGILLSEDASTPAIGGCVTPAIALGSASAPRFERAGVRFSVED